MSVNESKYIVVGEEGGAAGGSGQRGYRQKPCYVWSLGWQAGNGKKGDRKDRRERLKGRRQRGREGETR